MTGVIDALNQLRGANQLPNYIEYVRFPRFKDLAEDTQIDFSFPMTVLIGANGTRKSTVLKGLQGCPKGMSPRTYWFSTAADPIKEEEAGKKHSIIHAYKNITGELVECLKVRTEKQKRTLDYWETSKPSKIYGMEDKKRHDPVTKKVLYLNFRSLLPAFDKCFFYSGRSNVQDYIRNKTRRLNQAINDGSVAKVQGIAQNEARKPLTASALKHVSHILGKRYVEGNYIRHKFFDGWGETVRLNTTHHAYTEAFAGSGEVAIAILVQQIENADKASLIILDEPEVSLHPEAQKRLKEYLLDKIKTDKHQIVISTHSPFMADGLPKSAIKAFRISQDTGKTEVIQNLSHLEAFSVIGYELPAADKKILWVEDVLAEKLVKAVLKTFDVARQSLFEVRVMGSNTQMFKSIAHACGVTRLTNHFYIFDGDCKPEFPADITFQLNERHQCNLYTVLHGDVNLEFLGSVIKSQSAGQEVKSIGLNVAQDDANRLAQYKDYITFMSKNAYYLPGKTPEQLIWSDDHAQALLALMGIPQLKITACMGDIAGEQDPKKKFDLYCRTLKGEEVESSQILHEQENFTTKFVQGNNADVLAVKDMLNVIAEI